MDIAIPVIYQSDDERALWEATAAILRSMYSSDPVEYAKHTSEDLSSFEPDIVPYRIDGLGFHLTLIAAGGNGMPARLDLLTPRVQVYGDTGIVTYTLLKTFASRDTGAKFLRINEARVFARIDEVWKMVHLHKSPAH